MREPEAERHTIEEGVITNFFHYIWKRRNNLPEHEDRGLDVRIPHTICYEHNFPKGWYCTTPLGISRRTGKDIDTKAVRDALCKQRSAAPGAEGDPVALYIEIPPGGATNQYQLEFFDVARLREFLGGGQRSEGDYTPPKNGLLQQFVRPQGRHNSMIQVVWSSHLCLIEKRQNIYPLSSSRDGQSAANAAPAAAQQEAAGRIGAAPSLWERAVTWQGPSALSAQAYCAPNVAESIKKVCGQIVTHFRGLEHRQVEWMVLYFKTDPDQNLWLMWCSSLRLKPLTPQPQRSPRILPVFRLPPSCGAASKSMSFLTDEDRCRLNCKAPSMGPLGESYGTGRGTIGRCSYDGDGPALPTSSRLHRRPCTAPSHGIALCRAGLAAHGGEGRSSFASIPEAFSVTVESGLCDQSVHSALPPVAARDVAQSGRSAAALKRATAASRLNMAASGSARGPSATPGGPTAIAVQKRSQRRSSGASRAGTAPLDLVAALRAELASRPQGLQDSVVARAEAAEAGQEWLDGLLYEVYSHFLQSKEAMNVAVPVRLAAACPALVRAIARLPGIERTQPQRWEDEEEDELLGEDGEARQRFFVFRTKPQLLRLHAAAGAGRRALLAEELKQLRRGCGIVRATMPAAASAVLLVAAAALLQEQLKAQAAEAPRARRRHFRTYH
eukprot:TRINITY_DN70613_c0_g1_i1.p1 TRINITY_DN70613_c0_g1~~TRINITY_DN70613_c0_g1_i1.p1  ORF type:complete len:698 (+),score=226.77 TRINITY_DN70613_c0_g1_i1:88-2094(+)